MPKKCIICSEPAEFNIKDTSDYYCKDCADEHFADLSMLIKVENAAQRIRRLIEEKSQEEK